LRTKGYVNLYGAAQSRISGEIKMQDNEDNREYVALVNDEEQYSLWLAELAVPAGWKQVGSRGTKQACLDYIKNVWTDMRPLSVRKADAARAQQSKH
jgi:MbtH protein